MNKMSKAVCKGYTECFEGRHVVRYGFFEYRGHEYQVRYAGWYQASDEEPWMQHKSEQKRIDNIVDCKSQSPFETETIDWNNEMDKIFEMLDWND